MERRMPDTALMLRATAVAGALAGAILAIVAGITLFRTRRPVRALDPALLSIGWVLAVAGGFVTGVFVLGLGPRWPPKEDRDRFLLVLLPAAIIVELIAAFPRVPRWIAWPLRACVAAGAARIILHGTVYLAEAGGEDSKGWLPEEAARWLGVLGVGLLGAWAILTLRLHVVPTRSVPLALAIVCGGAAATVMYSGSATDGQLGLPLAGALVGATVVSFLLPPPGDTAPVSIGLVCLFALLVSGRFLSSLSMTHAIILFVAPLLCWLTALPYVRRLKPWVGFAACILAVAIPVAIVVHQAEQAHNATMQPSGDSEGAEYEDMYRSMK
jgi:hypothetical protein